MPYEKRNILKRLPSNKLFFQPILYEVKLMKTNKQINKGKKIRQKKKIKKVGINQADKSKVEIVSTLSTVIHYYLLSCCYGYTQIYQYVFTHSKLVRSCDLDARLHTLLI